MEGFEGVEEETVTSEDDMELLLPKPTDAKHEDDDYEELQRSADELLNQK